MIIVDKAEKTTINIPKNSLGNLTYNRVNLEDYYTKEQVDELIANTTISYAVFDYDENDVVNLVAGDISKVFEDYKQHKPIMIFAPVDSRGKMGIVNCLQLLLEENGYDNDYLIGYVNYFDGDSITYRRYTFNHLGTTGYANATKNFLNYYTKGEVNELIDNVEVDLTNYYTKEEIDDIVENTTIPYLVINKDWNGYESGDFESVRQAIGDKKPYFIYAPAPLGGYFSPNYAERVYGQINCHFFYHTDTGTNYYFFVYLHSDRINKSSKTVQYATTDELSKKGVYGLIVNYNEEFNEYTYNGVEFSTLKQAIENGKNQYAIYLPSVDNTYKIAAQEIVVVNDNEIRCITIENNGNTQTTTNWTIQFNDDYFEMHITKGDSYTKNIATQDWIEQQGYLTSVPDEYITDTELTNKGYATTTYVDTQIGNINTILENIIG